MVIKYKKISFPRPSKFYPKWYFWFENKPSGNPGRFPATLATLEDKKNFASVEDLRLKKKKC
jgi:hypothetical protein